MISKNPWELVRGIAVVHETNVSPGARLCASSDSNSRKILMPTQSLRLQLLNQFSFFDVRKAEFSLCWSLPMQPSRLAAPPRIHFGVSAKFRFSKVISVSIWKFDSIERGVSAAVGCDGGAGFASNEWVSQVSVAEICS